MTLRQLRKKHNLSQQEMADKLKIKQPAISKIEQRDDIQFNTLKTFIEALGGTLDIVANFPDEMIKITL